MEAPRPSILGGYRPGLRSVVGASATAYGYTLTVGPTSMLLTHAYGPPKPVEVLLFSAAGRSWPSRWWGLLPSEVQASISEILRDGSTCGAVSISSP